MKSNQTPQSFVSGGMRFTCNSVVGGGFVAQTTQNVIEWYGDFHAENFGILSDASFDVVAGEKSILVDVTRLKLTAESAYCYAQGEVPKGMPLITLIAKTDQLQFWENFLLRANLGSLNVALRDANGKFF
jgi:hypothetical protein